MNAKAASAMEVVTGRYEFSHGRKPSGYGAWAFGFHGVDNGPAITGWPPRSMLYGEAKRWARRHAASIGAQYIMVLP